MGEGSSLKDRLTQELKDALRAGEKVRLGALRMLSAAVKNREIDLRRDLSDQEFQEVASREVKRRNEAIEAYESAGREELVAKETEEREILQAYLPEPLSEEELNGLVDEGIKATGASTSKEMGKVIGYVMSKAKGRAAGGRVQSLVRQRLGE
jgi:uncharacterized protein YqeY